ncbi:MAG: hypothetical protein ACLR6J_09820 [Parabacteroides merdae]
MGNSELKAVAILNGEKGSYLAGTVRLVKKGWKIADKTAQSSPSTSAASKR